MYQLKSYTFMKKEQPPLHTNGFFFYDYILYYNLMIGAIVISESSFLYKPIIFFSVIHNHLCQDCDKSCIHRLSPNLTFIYYKIIMSCSFILLDSLAVLVTCALALALSTTSLTFPLVIIWGNDALCLGLEDSFIH